MEEPLLDVEDIQGHVLAGFGGGHEVLLGITLHPGILGSGRAVLLDLIDRVTPLHEAQAARARRVAARHAGMGRPHDPSVKLALAVSAAGIAILGGDPASVPDIFFRQGMAADAAALGDPVDPVTSIPVDWVFGDRPETTPDILAIIASDDPERSSAAADDIAQALEPFSSIVWREIGRRLERDGEHFGFADAISQPGIRGLFAPDQPVTSRHYPADHPFAAAWARPGQRLTWPGQFVFGYPTLRPDAPSQPGPVVADPRLRNGSLLVVRRLRQDVAAFEEAMDRLAADLAAATGRSWSRDEAGALCVGRWRDGTPLSISRAAPSLEIANDRFRRNGFRYVTPLPPATLTDEEQMAIAFPGAPSDPIGRNCPFFAHLRKVNPRDHGTDEGSSNITLRMQMLRRGIPYGPIWNGTDDGSDRGLIFMSYQTSIEQQFRRMMTLWVNHPTRPIDGGIDPILGLSPLGGRRLRWNPGSGDLEVSVPGRWVHPTGGGYFFVPGLNALRALATGSQA